MKQAWSALTYSKELELDLAYASTYAKYVQNTAQGSLTVFGAVITRQKEWCERTKPLFWACDVCVVCQGQ